MSIDSVEKARELKKEIEEDIKEKIQVFMDETGLEVRDIFLHTSTAMRNKPIVREVNLNIRI